MNTALLILSLWGIYDCGDDLRRVEVTPHEVDIGSRYNYDIFRTGEHGRETFANQRGETVTVERLRNGFILLTRFDDIGEIEYECREVHNGKESLQQLR